MASKTVPITSSSHLKSSGSIVFGSSSAAADNPLHLVLASSSYVVVDFYADWCGPCKQISPIFEQLATAESKPGRLTFCKVDVDSQREVASFYGISA